MLVFAAFVLWLLLMRRRRRARYRELARKGMPVKAQIIDRFTRRLPKGTAVRYVLRYRFQTMQGQVVENRTAVGQSGYDQVAASDSIDVFYLPERPEINRTRAFLLQRGHL